MAFFLLKILLKKLFEELSASTSSVNLSLRSKMKSSSGNADYKLLYVPSSLALDSFKSVIRPERNKKIRRGKVPDGDRFAHDIHQFLYRHPHTNFNNAD
jgi:hypothetical protein